MKKSIFVINKSDLGLKKPKELEQYNPISISIKNDVNIDQLISQIKKNLKNKFVSIEDTIITRERHRQQLEQCVLHLDDFSKKKMKKILIKQLRILDCYKTSWNVGWKSRCRGNTW